MLRRGAIYGMLLLAVAVFAAPAARGFTPGPSGAQFVVRGTHVVCMAVRPDNHFYKGGYVFCTSPVYARRHSPCGGPVGVELLGSGRSRVSFQCGGAASHGPLRRGERLQTGRIRCVGKHNSGITLQNYI